MKKKVVLVIGIFCLAVLMVAVQLHGCNMMLTGLADGTNVVCKGQKFASTEEAIDAMDAEERELYDTSLDYCPPYRLQFTLEIEQNIFVFYSFCDDFDGEEEPDYAVRVLKHHPDGTLYFDRGFSDFVLKEPKPGENYYYYTNIDTSKGEKSISFLYLPKDSEKEIYVDGKKAEKVLVTAGGQEFYVCYVISKRDTFFSDVFTPIDKRHRIEIG